MTFDANDAATNDWVQKNSVVVLSHINRSSVATYFDSAHC